MITFRVGYIVGSIYMQNRKVVVNITIEEKALLNVKEIMEYTGFGENTVRNLLKKPKCTFALRRGNRWYANRKKLDKWIDSQTGK